MKAIKYLWSFPLYLALCAFLALPVCAREQNSKEITLQEAARLVEQNPQDLVIVDVRTPAEFAAGHLPKAKNMDFFGGRFEIDARALPKDSAILVYCRSGMRSAGAAQIFKEAGLSKILHMHEGFDAWQKKGLPVEKSKSASAPAGKK